MTHFVSQIVQNLKLNNNKKQDIKQKELKLLNLILIIYEHGLSSMSMS